MTDPRDDDVRSMRRAVQLAEAGWGRVHPNPLVGAVVVRDGEIIGEGAHQEFGGPHAEVEALRQAGARALGATLYVTLEPCAHHGKTPPCVDAILGAGIRRVVIGVEDPHPHAKGGAARLREGGVDVEIGVEQDAARAQNALFLVPLLEDRPFLALKLGMTLDARLGREGQPTRITGGESEAEVHRLRSGFDAILVGGRTARIDNPRLTVRRAPAGRVPPVRVVADTAAHLPMGSTLVAGSSEAPLWVLAGESAPGTRVASLESAGVKVLRCAVDAEGRLDLADAIDRLWREGIRTILCEGGGRLGAALLGAGLVDRLFLFLAPSLLGGEGVPAFPLPESTGRTLRLRSVAPVGGDTLLTLERSG